MSDDSQPSTGHEDAETPEPKTTAGSDSLNDPDGTPKENPSG